MAKKKPPAKVRQYLKDSMPPEILEYFREQGRKGGKLSGPARMEKLTPEQRSAIAKTAVDAREAKRKAAKKAPAKAGAES